VPLQRISKGVTRYDDENKALGLRLESRARGAICGDTNERGWGGGLARPFGAIVAIFYFCPWPPRGSLLGGTIPLIRK
jgi:hypothetical protein